MKPQSEAQRVYSIVSYICVNTQSGRAGDGDASTCVHKTIL